MPQPSLGATRRCCARRGSRRAARVVPLARAQPQRCALKLQRAAHAPLQSAPAAARGKSAATRCIQSDDHAPSRCASASTWPPPSSARAARCKSLIM
eukprot:115287-Pleurochrysis_carterae.AAC.3